MSFFEIILNAVFTGVGVTVGTYLANRALIKNIEKIEGRLNNKIKKHI